MPRQPQEASLHIAYDANQQLIGRVNDLLTVIDIEEGHITLDRQVTSLDKLIKSALMSLKQKSEVKGLSIRYNPPELPLGKIFIDSYKIRLVLEKLIDNSITYTNKSGVIGLTLSNGDGHIRFEIEDNGIGIPAEEQANVFTPFYRATNSIAMEPNSSGVGLAIAKYFVEQHGGQIGMKSKEGVGSTFWFELPIELGPDK